MLVQKISFTSAEHPQVQQKEPAIYSKKGYMTLMNTARFEFGTALTFGLLESIDKFQLINKDAAKDALKKTAKSHTKRNILIGIACGIGSIFLGKLFDKKMMPWSEKMYEKADKLEKINEKAKELVEKETQTKPPETSQVQEQK